MSDDAPIKITPRQWQSISSAAMQAMGAALMPWAYPGMLVAQALQNERKAAELSAIVGGAAGEELVERLRREAKQIGEQHPAFSHQAAFDVLFDLELDALKYGEEAVQTRRMWTIVAKLECGIEVEGVKRDRGRDSEER